jgi:hypothetical protein
MSAEKKERPLTLPEGQSDWRKLAFAWPPLDYRFAANQDMSRVRIQSSPPSLIRCTPRDPVFPSSAFVLDTDCAFRLCVYAVPSVLVVGCAPASCNCASGMRAMLRGGRWGIGG